MLHALDRMRTKPALKERLHYLHGVLTLTKTPTKRNRTILFSQFLATKFLDDTAIAFLISVGFLPLPPPKQGLQITREGTTTALMSDAIHLLFTEMQTFRERQTSSNLIPHTESLDAKSRLPVPLCSCGFYGTINGLCSSCHMTQLQAQSKTLRKKWRVLIHLIRAVHRFQHLIRPVQENPHRCWQCQRKIGLSGFPCHCGYIYCGLHRYANEHNCPWDYRKAHQQFIARNNPLIKRRKL